MNDKLFERTQEQAGKVLETLAGLTMTNLRFAREEAERQLRQGMGQLEFVQQTFGRQYEQSLSLARTFAELQDGMVQGLTQAWSGARG